MALSTFRRAEKAIDVAIEKCREVKKWMVVYVVDINTARYLIGIEEEFFVGLGEKWLNRRPLKKPRKKPWNM